MAKRKNTQAPEAPAAPLLHAGAKAAVVKALRELKATSSNAAVPVGRLAEVLGVNRKVVYDHLAGTRGKIGSTPGCLAAAGYVAIVRLPGVNGACAYLTAKGESADLDKPPFGPA